MPGIAGSDPVEGTDFRLLCCVVNRAASSTS
jgi:hypothetical protein